MDALGREHGLSPRDAWYNLLSHAEAIREQVGLQARALANGSFLATVAPMSAGRSSPIQSPPQLPPSSSPFTSSSVSSGGGGGGGGALSEWSAKGSTALLSSAAPRTTLGGVPRSVPIASLRRAFATALARGVDLVCLSAPGSAAAVLAAPTLNRDSGGGSGSSSDGNSSTEAIASIREGAAARLAAAKFAAARAASSAGEPLEAALEAAAAARAEAEAAAEAAVLRAQAAVDFCTTRRPLRLWLAPQHDDTTTINTGSSSSNTNMNSSDDSAVSSNLSWEARMRIEAAEPSDWATIRGPRLAWAFLSLASLDAAAAAIAAAMEGRSGAPSGEAEACDRVPLSLLVSVERAALTTASSASSSRACELVVRARGASGEVQLLRLEASSAAERDALVDGLELLRREAKESP